MALPKQYNDPDLSTTTRKNWQRPENLTTTRKTVDNDRQIDRTWPEEIDMILRYWQRPGKNDHDPETMDNDPEKLTTTRELYKDP